MMMNPNIETMNPNIATDTKIDMNYSLYELKLFIYGNAKPNLLQDTDFLIVGGVSP